MYQKFVKLQDIIGKTHPCMSCDPGSWQDLCCLQCHFCCYGLWAEDYPSTMAELLLFCLFPSCQHPSWKVCLYLSWFIVSQFWMPDVHNQMSEGLVPLATWGILVCFRSLSWAYVGPFFLICLFLASCS